MTGINPDNMPHELKVLRRWVCHKRKVPYQPNGTMASSTDPATWAPFEECMAAYEAGGFDGVGFVLGGGFVGVDLDHHVTGGCVSPMAQDIVKALCSYTEVSPSGEGLHIICRGDPLPPGPRKREDIGLEMYDTARYFTMTGKAHTGYAEVGDRTEELRAVYERYMRAGSGSSSPDVLSKPLRKGERNNALTSFAGSLRRRGASREDIEEVLLGVNAIRCDPPLEDAEVRGIARSTARYDPTDAAIRQEYEYNDIGDARFILDSVGHHIRHIHPTKPKEAGIWYAWDGARWLYAGYGLTRCVVRGALEDRARELRLQAEILGASDKTGAKAALTHALRVGQSIKVDNTLRMLSTFEELQTSYAAFDADPYALNCRNGIIDLQDGTLSPHDPAAYHSKIAGVAYDPGATAPRWKRFIGEITQGDEELAAYFQRAAGYSLIGAMPEHVFFMPVGSRRNGKTTFLELMRECMGDYAVTVQVGAFMQRGPSDLNPDIPKLRGARFCTTSETEGTQRLAMGLLKGCTGGGTVSGRGLYMDPVEFKPYAKLWIDTNNPPYISPRDKGIWARAHIIPFNECFEGRENKYLKEQLMSERPGVFSWMVQGAQAWREEGLNMPSAVKDKTRDIRDEQDTVEGFITDVCATASDTTGLTPRVPLGVLYAEYGEWCRQSGCHALSKREFVKDLEARGYAKDEGRGHSRMITGLMVLDSVLPKPREDSDR
ncbi:MAG TPA: phage/plasmid primase, P4 family [Candidatus Methanofastidiosa archaeon]|nr:phage/plasmid primase, P4 family [Candidatus Methanofastidiosa archaeon]